MIFHTTHKFQNSAKRPNIINLPPLHSFISSIPITAIFTWMEISVHFMVSILATATLTPIPQVDNQSDLFPLWRRQVLKYLSSWYLSLHRRQHCYHWVGWLYVRWFIPHWNYCCGWSIAKIGEFYVFLMRKLLQLSDPPLITLLNLLIFI